MKIYAGVIYTYVDAIAKVKTKSGVLYPVDCVKLIVRIMVVMSAALVETEISLEYDNSGNLQPGPP